MASSSADLNCKSSPHFLLGHLPLLRKDPLGLMTSLTAAGEIVPLRLPTLAYLINSPALISQVLNDKHENYRKSRMNRRIRIFLGDGLLTSEGDWWKSQRRLLQPMFGKAQYTCYVSVIIQSVERLVKRLHEMSAQQSPVDIHSEMNRLTATVIGQIVLGINF